MRTKKIFKHLDEMYVEPWGFVLGVNVGWVSTVLPVCGVVVVKGEVKYSKDTLLDLLW